VICLSSESEQQEYEVQASKIPTRHQKSHFA
jgi:hypothetical protein